MTIGEKIRACREAKHLTQTELGLACGVTKQTIFKYETGVVTNIPIDKLQFIASMLDVSTAYLMGWDGPIEQETKKQLPVAKELSSAKQAMYEFIDTLSDDQLRQLLRIAQAAFDR